MYIERLFANHYIDYGTSKMIDLNSIPENFIYDTIIKYYCLLCNVKLRELIMSKEKFHNGK